MIIRFLPVFLLFFTSCGLVKITDLESNTKPRKKKKTVIVKDFSTYQCDINPARRSRVFYLALHDSFTVYDSIMVSFLTRGHFLTHSNITGKKISGKGLALFSDVEMSIHKIKMQIIKESRQKAIRELVHTLKKSYGAEKVITSEIINKKNVFLELTPETEITEKDTTLVVDARKYAQLKNFKEPLTEKKIYLLCKAVRKGLKQKQKKGKKSGGMQMNIEILGVDVY